MTVVPAKKKMKVIKVTVPPGALGVTFQEKNPKQATGVFLKTVSETSALKGKVKIGAHLLSINGVNTAVIHLKEIQKVIVSTAQRERTLEFEQEDDGRANAPVESDLGTVSLL